MQHLAQLVADQVDDGLEVQLGGQSLLDGVDDLQLSHTFLFGLEQAGVFDGHAHIGGEGLQQMHVVFIEGVDPVIRQNDDAQHPVSGKDRHPQPGFGDHT